MQRQINAILKNYKNFSRTFIDNIVVYKKTLKNHFKHFHTIFVLLNFFNILFSSIKLFFDYFSVQLLNQKVNVFQLITIVEKIEAIVKLKFSKTFKNFEIYFDFIEELRHYVSYFAQKSNTLQLCKSFFIRLISSNKEIS